MHQEGSGLSHMSVVSATAVPSGQSVRAECGEPGVLKELQQLGSE